MQTYEVSYSILTEARTDTFGGTGRSDLQNITMQVQAINGGQAQAIVEGQYGGKNTCIVHAVRPLW
jgi:hypothetical protein